MNRKLNLAAMSVDEMWQLHEEISKILSDRLTSEKRELEKRLAQLHRDEEIGEPADLLEIPAINDPRKPQRRKYPRVVPKYRNPNVPAETWSGRGKQPRWLKAALQTGRAIEEFIVSNSEAGAREPGRQQA